MPFSHVVYIDEAGDEGVGKLKSPAKSGQSQWLLVGAAIVHSEDDLSLPKWRGEILTNFPTRQRTDLHFRDFKHAQRVVVCQEIAKRPIFSCVTFSNKTTILGSQWAEKFKCPGYLYNYLTRWLLERVTSFCVEDCISSGKNPSLKVVFSRRQGTDYQKMRQYMELMRDGKEKVQPTRSINWSVFDPADIVVANHSKWAGLQIADVITSAYFVAVEPNSFGNYDGAYADLLRPLAIRDRENALNVGVTPVPSWQKSAILPHHKKFFQSFRK